MTATGSSSKIVVGVNGSRSSRRALTWALRQARLTDGELHTVISPWTIPVNHGWTPVPERPEGSDWPELARKVLDEAIDEVIGHTDPDRIHRHVVQGHPVRVLLEAASDADLLVVGSGGNGSAGTPLSPLGQDLVSRAPCPVVVVRGPAELLAPAGASAADPPTASEPRSPVQTGDPQPAIEVQKSPSSALQDRTAGGPR
jgi:nucleotide-binding universal stress UspA family protein